MTRPSLLLVCQGISPYRDNWAVPLYRAYAERAPVVYLDPDSSRHSLPRLASVADDIRRQPDRRGIWEAPLPASIPGSRFSALGSVNRWFGIRQVLRRLRATGDATIVLVLQRPDLLPTSRGLGADVVVYEVVDDYVALAQDPKAARRIARAHRRMMKECDLVWATSSALAQQIAPYRPDVVETTNGVDFAAFASCNGGDVKGLGSIPRPRIGLVGKLNDRIDWDLLETLCAISPDYHFVIVGPVYDAGPLTSRALARLDHQANVHRVPGVSAEELPDCIAALDVCLIPYRLTAATVGINPLKVYQYLAAGKPVVASALPSLAGFAGVVTCCDTAEEFRAAIGAALPTSDDTGARGARQARARASDWSVVARSRLQVIDEYCGRRSMEHRVTPEAGAGRA